MFKRNVVIFTTIFITLLITLSMTPTKKYPVESFDIGVKKSVVFKALTIDYINTVKDGVVTTKGKFKFDLHEEFSSVNLEYVILDKDLKPIIVIFLIDVENPEKVIEFEKKYRFSGTYEYGLFLINLKVKPEEKKGDNCTNV